MVEKTSTRGRPRTYNPDEALDRAAELFWAHGFAATSLDDLSTAMGMGRPSIYNAFGDKEALFLKALTRYRDTVGSAPLRAMDASGSIDVGIHAFLEAIVDYATADETHPGCLMGSVAIGTDLPDVRDFLRENLDWLHGQLVERLSAAVAAGQLPSDYPLDAGARTVVNALLSLSARARVGTPREELLSEATAAATAVLSAV